MRLLMLLLFCSILDAAEWLRLKSNSFELITTAGEAQGRETLQHFEQVSDFFQQLNQTASSSPIPIRIILFADDKQYAPYRANSAAAAYFITAPDADYIVMAGASKGLYTVALHEYVHLLIRRSRVTLPLWLEEGFADLFSTLKAAGNQTQIGAAPPGRTQGLLTGAILPLGTILSATRNSPLYNEGNRIGMFYSESWALTHMLRLSDDFRPGFEKFFNLIVSGYSAEEALEKAYSKSPSDVEAHLMSYLGRGRLRLVLVPIKLKKEMPSPVRLPDAEFTAKLSLATLLQTKDSGKAVEELEALIKEYPARPEPVGALAYLWASSGQTEKGMDGMARAIAMQYRNPRILKDYSLLLLNSGNNSMFLSAAKRQLEIEPDDHEQRLRIGSVLFQMGDCAQALSELRKIEKPPSNMAVRYQHGIAACSLKLGNLDQARSAIAEIRKVAHTPQELAELNQLEQALASAAR